MITESEYFGEKPHTPEQFDAAAIMLNKVVALLTFLQWTFPKDPDTGTCISGSWGGAGDGGFRLPTSLTGASNSQHKQAHAVDVYDPEDVIDSQLTDELLRHFALYREHPGSTRGWCHLQDIPPPSGRRTFIP